MSTSTERLALEAMALPAPERAELARRLIASLDPGEDEPAAAERAGRLEAVRRLGELRRGEAQPVAHEELFRRVRDRLPR